MNNNSKDSAATGLRLDRIRVSLSTAILTSMVVGILVGIFFGEHVAFMEVLGNGFIRLLQMTILPYIMASLILGIGSLTFEKARTLAVKAGLILLLTWLIAFVFILLTPLAFPHWESASFFSSSLVEIPPPPDFLELYIPANPFHSMAANLIPAVVLFSLALGIALIGIKNKEPFLKDLEVLCEALMRVAGFVVKLTPIGVFAISASAAGTMSIEELSKLQVYLITFNLGCLLLTFWILPLMVAVATPFKYRDVIKVSRDALVTAFTTGNLFVILPVLTENAKRMFADYGATKENTDAYVDVIIPVSFNFPNIGKLIMLSFILFAGWFSGNQLALSDYPQFVTSGLMSFFGGVDVALPFMLDLMRIPSDMYQLYVATGIVNGRTATLLGAMNLLVFTLLVVAALTGYLRTNWRRIAIAGGASVALSIALLLGARVYFQIAVENAYVKDQVLAGMQLLEGHSEAVVHKQYPEIKRDPVPQLPLITRIQRRGELRIGYMQRLPWSFFNTEGQLVGLDVEMAHQLAEELGVKPVFIPVEFDAIPAHLERSDVDLVMSAIAVTTDVLTQMLFSDPYMDLTPAVVIRDHQRERFLEMSDIRERAGLKMAVRSSKIDTYFVDKLRHGFPLAEIVVIDMEQDFFEAEKGTFDALVSTAEGGSAWTLLYPSFTVVVPRPLKLSVPLAYPVARKDQEFADFVSTWIELKKKDGTFQRFYDHWILGLTAQQTGPRWSVVRDVLHWVD